MDKMDKVSKKRFRFLQSFYSCTMMKLVRDWRRIKKRKAKILAEICCLEFEEVNYYALYKWKL